MQPEVTPLTASDVISLSEAAAILHMARSTVADLAGRREIPHFRAGRRILFRLSELDRWSRTGGTDRKQA